MANIFNYVEKYGDKMFKEKEFNELDNIIFSFLAYLDFTDTDINNIKNPTLELIGKQYLKKYKLKQISKYGFSEKDAYKLLEKVYQKKRYKDIILDDYIYNIENTQFSALTFKISKKLIYISFEGTGHLMKAWKESLSLLSTFPVVSHYQAIEYANKHIKLLGPKVIIGGHSKGGNLALIASMYIKKYKKIKIKKIYNNDGPGLRTKQYNSLKYKLLKRKYTHIVPTNSMIGIMLKNDKYKVVKTNAISFFSHTMSRWRINDDKILEGALDRKHKKLEKNMVEWLILHDDEEKKSMIKSIFDLLDKCKISDTMTLIKLKNIIKLIKELKNVDLQTKNLAIDLLKNTFFS
jgi:hypothetical protein